MGFLWEKKKPPEDHPPAVELPPVRVAPWTHGKAMIRVEDWRVFLEMECVHPPETASSALGTPFMELTTRVVERICSGRTNMGHYPPKGYVLSPEGEVYCTPHENGIHVRQRVVMSRQLFIAQDTIKRVHVMRHPGFDLHIWWNDDETVNLDRAPQEKKDTDDA